jgi:archaeosortase A (PGF-CTERM-specific)
MLNKPVVFLSPMSPLWMLSNILWLSLILLLASALAKISSLAGLGWILFGIYWMGQPGYYLSIEDYFNAILTVAAGFLCIYVAWIMLFKRCQTRACKWASFAASVCGIVYFPFAEVEVLRTWLIGETTLITVLFLQTFSVPASLQSWNVMALNGRSVEIILACTAIESIALFIGVILSVQAPPARKFAALALSTLIIYSLNIVRNAFVMAAYGEGWFGDDSFFVAHNIIAKAGSTLALLIIAYFIFSILPELLALIDELGGELMHPRRDHP